MITPQLLSYIKIQLQKNVSAEEIKKTLLANGWQLADVEEGFLKARAPVSSSVIKNSPNFQTQPFNSSAGVVSSQAVTPTKNSSANQGGNKFLFILAIIAFFLVLGAGGALAYFYYTPSSFTPDQIVLKTFSNLSQIKSLEYAGDLKASFNQDEVIAASQQLGSASSSLLIPLSVSEATSSSKTGEININFKGSTDLQNLNDPRSSFVFNISTSPFGLTGMTSATSTGFNFGLEFRNLGQVLYVKLNNAPEIGFFDLTPFKEQWIKFDVASSTNTKFTTSLTADQTSQIKAVLTKRPIIKVGEVLTDEKVGEIDTYHYRLTIDKNELKQAAVEIANIVQTGGLKAEDLQKFEQGLASAETPNLEVWIGKKDLYPYKLLISSAIKNSDQSAEIGQLTLSTNFKNFNQPISIVVPDSPKTIQEIMTVIYQKATSTTQLKK